MEKTAFVYFISNTHNNVLYIGVTNNLLRRVAEHKVKVNKGFTYKYNCDKLVYFEEYDFVIDAIAREKQLKNWKREWKNALVNKANPAWNDLSEEVGVTKEFIESIRAYYEEIAGQARNDEMNEARNDEKG
jgi:putative endonuclease